MLVINPQRTSVSTGMYIPRPLHFSAFHGLWGALRYWLTLPCQKHNTTFLPFLYHSVSQLSDEHRSKFMCLLVHLADISHPGKPWATHYQWTKRITEEFFRQGDWEKELGLSQSPLCDRDTTLFNECRQGMQLLELMVSLHIYMGCIIPILKRCKLHVHETVQFMLCVAVFHRF